MWGGARGARTRCICHLALNWQQCQRACLNLGSETNVVPAAVAPGVPTVQTLSRIEEGCDRKELTLVVHPAIRRAMHRYEDSFYIGVRWSSMARATASSSCPSKEAVTSALPSPSEARLAGTPS